MEASAPKNFDEFKVEDQIELTSRRIAERFSRSNFNYQEEIRFPQEDNSPITKYQFLKTFSAGIRSEGKKMNSISCPNDEPSDCNYTCKDHGPHTPSTSNQEGCASEEQTSKSEDIPGSNNIGHQEDAHSNPNIVVSGNPFSGCLSASSFGIPHGNESPVALQAPTLGVFSSGNEQINCDLSEIPSNNNPVGVISDEDGKTTCSADMEDQGSLEGSASDYCSSGSEIIWSRDEGRLEQRRAETKAGWSRGELEMEEEPCEGDGSLERGVVAEKKETSNMAVVVPDYLMHKDLYATESSLYFSCSCIKLEGVNAYGSKGTFSFEWDIADVMSIDCLWCARVETAIVKLCIRSAADLNTEAPDGTSGTTELKFAVYDPRWFESQDEIMKVDARYKTIWRVLHDTDANEGNLVGKNQMKSYFPHFSEHFEDIIYPKCDPDAVSISRRDVELLQPETFINDTIIDFYIKYLTNNIKPEDKNKFHFFNSFFFRKLADLDKNPSSASDGKAAFLRVRKWTRKVNLFEKNYVFIPINFSLHWSLIVICHPGEIPTFRDEDADTALRIPCILHMDSIKGTHKGLKDLVQSYLWEEWKERQGDTSVKVSSSFLNLRFVSLELPQQENSFDCGLFLLHYVELFLEEAPAYFNPFKLSKFSNFLNFYWFPPAEASLKRASIQRLICELLKSHSQEIPSANPDTQCQTFESMKNNCEKENGVEFLLEEHVAVNSCSGFGPSDDKVIGIELLGTPVAPQFVKDSGLVLKDLFDQGVTVGSLPNGQFQSTDHDIMPITENEVTDEPLALSADDISCYRQLSECTVGYGYTASYSLKVDGGPNEDDHVDFSASEASSSDSDSSEVMVDENPVSRLWYRNRSEITEQAKPISLGSNLCTTESSASGCNEELDTHIVEDSQEVNDDDNDEKKGSPSSCQENSAASFDHSQVELGENEIHPGEKHELSEHMKSLESVDQRALKRARLTLPLEEESQYAAS